MLDFIYQKIDGIILGVIATVLYEWLRKKIKEWGIKKNKEKIKPINILEEFSKIGEVCPVVSFGDSDAIKVEPLMQYGKGILIVKIDLSKKPLSCEKRNFVMALMKYLPCMNWKYFVELGYCFKFKIRGNIKGIQLEIKNGSHEKVIDEYIKVTNSFAEHSFDLSRMNGRLEDVGEICFTVFCESKYIDSSNGRFEIYDCLLTK